MAKFTLHIDCDDVHELAQIANRIAGGMEPVTETAAATAPVEKATRGRKAKADTPFASSPAPDADVSTSTEQTATTTAIADTATTSGAPAPSMANSASQVAPVQTPAPASAASPASAVTYEDLKAALTKLMEAKSAKVAQDVLKKSVGFGSLSSTPPEKYGIALAAINEALAS